MQETKRLIQAVAQDGTVSVLIRGETGTGKELIARAVHANGRRSGGPFVPVPLNALPLPTLTAELFGYERGAFTDARNRHIGYLERAHGGVLFLDEIGDVEPDMQLKLLRFLEEREFHRLGGTSAVCLDVQVVAATNANLEARVAQGGFREDLYFRLKVHEILVPPLRERVDDIPLLVDHFLRLFGQQGKKIKPLAPTALEALKRFGWPGNVRQLKNSIESALFTTDLRGHREIAVEDLPADVRQLQAAPGPRARRPGQPGFHIQEALARAELAFVTDALEVAQGQKARAWRLLGYHDRFAPLRRVQRIFARFPHLEQEFPRLKKDSRGRLPGTAGAEPGLRAGDGAG
jgi:DNA-binding NtrC family response regulator